MSASKESVKAAAQEVLWLVEERKSYVEKMVGKTDHSIKVKMDWIRENGQLHALMTALQVYTK